MSRGLAQLWRHMRAGALLCVAVSTVSLMGLAASYAVTQNSFEPQSVADPKQDIAGSRRPPSRAVPC